MLFQSLIEGLFISYPWVGSKGWLRTWRGFSPSLRDCLFLTNRQCLQTRGKHQVSVPHWGIVYFLPGFDRHCGDRWLWFQSLIEGLFISYFWLTYSDLLWFMLLGVRFSPSLRDCLFLTRAKKALLARNENQVSVPHWGIVYFLPTPIQVWVTPTILVSVPHWGIVYFLLSKDASFQARSQLAFQSLIEGLFISY